MFKKGTIVYLDETDSFGREITKRRPYVSISNPAFIENTGFAVVIPITSTVRNSPGHIVIETNSEVAGAANVIQLKSVDIKARNPQVAGRVSAQTLNHITQAVKIILLQ